MKSPRFFIALAGLLALAGMARAGAPDLSSFFLPLAFGQEPVPSVRPTASGPLGQAIFVPAQAPELLPTPKPISPAAVKTVGTFVIDGGSVIIGGLPAFPSAACVSCAKAGEGCPACAKPNAGVGGWFGCWNTPIACGVADACDNTHRSGQLDRAALERAIREFYIKTVMSWQTTAKPCEQCDDSKDCTRGTNKGTIKLGAGFNPDNCHGSPAVLVERQLTSAKCKCCEKCDDCKNCTCAKNKATYQASFCTGGIVQYLAAAKCKCCEKCEDCKDCTCGKKKACECCKDCKDCKECTCGKKKAAFLGVVPPKQTGRLEFDLNFFVPGCGPGQPTVVSGQPPMAHDFRWQPPLCEQRMEELVRQRHEISAAIEQVEKQLVQLAWQKKVGQCPAVPPAAATTSNTQRAHFLTDDFEAHCDTIRCVGGLVVLEGDVQLTCKKLGNGTRVQAARIEINPVTGSFNTVSTLPAVVQPVQWTYPPVPARDLRSPPDATNPLVIPPAPRPSAVPMPTLPQAPTLGLPPSIEFNY